MKQLKIKNNALKFLLILLLLTCSESAKREKNPVIEKIAEEVSSFEIENTIIDMVGFETRYPHKKQLEVAEYLYERAKAFLTTTEFHEYEIWGVKWKNVVAMIPGSVHPEEVVILCAHLDSKSEKRLAYAPGADDNASGCAAVLEAIRILSEHTFEKSIKFVFFSREENGWEGSAAYVQTIDNYRGKIEAVLNLDMIAYGDDSEDIDLVTRPGYAWLSSEIDALAQTYGLPVKKIISKHVY